MLLDLEGAKSLARGNERRRRTLKSPPPPPPPPPPRSPLPGKAFSESDVIFDRRPRREGGREGRDKSRRRKLPPSSPLKALSKGGRQPGRKRPRRRRYGLLQQQQQQRQWALRHGHLGRRGAPPPAAFAISRCIAQYEQRGWMGRREGEERP